MDTYLIADTHGQKIKCKGHLIHLGDADESLVSAPGGKMLIRGNHDHTPKQFDFVCEGMMKWHIWFSHEPAERLPKGAHYNIHGHLHGNKYSDYGYEKKKFHIELPVNKLVKLRFNKDGKPY